MATKCNQEKGKLGQVNNKKFFRNGKRKKKWKGYKWEGKAAVEVLKKKKKNWIFKMAVKASAPFYVLKFKRKKKNYLLLEKKSN